MPQPGQSALRAVFEPDLEVLRRLNTTESEVDLQQLKENMMTDVAKLQEITARLQASDTAALEALQQLKDQNVALAAQLAVVQTGDPTTQKVVDDVVGKLTTVANTVDAAVAANPATPNLAPSAVTPGGPPAAGPEVCGDANNAR